MNRPSPPSPGFSTIRFEKRNRIAWITLNRPRQLNAYNVAMRDDLFGALSAVHDDPEVRAMVLCGAGPAFSTGGATGSAATIALTNFGRASATSHPEGATPECSSRTTGE